MLSTFPEYDDSKLDFSAQAVIKELKELISSIRTLRSEMKLSPSERVPLIILETNKLNVQTEKILDFQSDGIEQNELIRAIKSLAKISEVKILDYLPKEFENSPSKLVGDFKLILKVTVDPESEKIRIRKEIDKFQLEINKAQNKLSNKNFLDKAPEKIVTQEKERMAFFSEKLQKLKHQITFFD